MRWIIPLLVVCTVLQTTVVPGLVTQNLRPDLALVLIVGWGSIRGWGEGLLAGLIGGVLRDATSAAPFGLNAIILGLLGLVAGVVMERLARTSILFPVLASAGGSIVGFFLSVLGLQAGGWVASWEHAVIFEAIPSALLTGLCMAVAFPIFRAVARRLAADEPGVGREV